MRSVVSVVVSCLILSVVTTAEAKWFGLGNKSDGSKSKDESFLRALSEDEARTFLSLYTQRERVREELRVLARIIREKGAEVGTFQNALKQQFDVAPDKVYQLDAEGKALYLLANTPGTNTADAAAATNAAAASDSIVTNAASSVKRVLHREISEQEVQNIVRLSAAKGVATSQIRALNLLYREKTMELGKANKLLKDHFAVEPQLNYRYEAATRCLYLIGSGKAESDNK